MISPFKEIIAYNAGNLVGYLKEIEIPEIFEPLQKEFSDDSLFSGAVKFILYAYSLESELLHTFGNSWITLHKKIYEKSGLPDDENVFDAVANLKSADVRKAIDNWLAYQNNEAFVDYTSARDLRRHCLEQSQTGDKLKDRKDAITYAKELLNTMEEAKARFIDGYEPLKPSMTALRKSKNTLGPQDFAQ